MFFKLSIFSKIWKNIYWRSFMKVVFVYNCILMRIRNNYLSFSFTMFSISQFCRVLCHLQCWLEHWAIGWKQFLPVAWPKCLFRFFSSNFLINHFWGYLLDRRDKCNVDLYTEIFFAIGISHYFHYLLNEAYRIKNVH